MEFRHMETTDSDLTRQHGDAMGNRINLKGQVQEMEAQHQSKCERGKFLN